MAARAKRSEAEVAATFLKWLEASGWDCYPEACFGTEACRVDIAATRCGLLHFFEVKTSMSLALLAQAEHWIGKAHYVSVVIPGQRRFTNGFETARR
ncbi:MAG: hypothetical protein JRN42_08850 [Nitrososphaerota archaeon]|nr:hypothetical protein [Nitrososphaerota archaeon]